MGTKDTYHSAEQQWIQHRTGKYLREKPSAGAEEEVSPCERAEFAGLHRRWGQPLLPVVMCWGLSGSPSGRYFFLKHTWKHEKYHKLFYYTLEHFYLIILLETILWYMMKRAALAWKLLLFLWLLWICQATCLRETGLVEHCPNSMFSIKISGVWRWESNRDYNDQKNLYFCLETLLGLVNFCGPVPRKSWHTTVS